MDKRNCAICQAATQQVARKAVGFFIAMVLLATVLQSLPSNVQAKMLLRAQKPLKLLQKPSSLIRLRHKRDTFSGEPQDEDTADYYDENYDVLPDMSAGSQPPSLGDRISEQAQQIADSFKKMWQSVTDSVRHCIDALRAMFGESMGGEELTPEQEQQILANLNEKYRLQAAQDGEILRDAYGNQV